MSSRVTRSATKLAAEPSSPTAAAATAASNVAASASTAAEPQSLPKSRKRKARDSSPENAPSPVKHQPTRGAKKQKTTSENTFTPDPPKPRRGPKRAAVMGRPGYMQKLTVTDSDPLTLDRSSSAPAAEKEKSPPVIPDTSRRKPSRSKKSAQGWHSYSISLSITDTVQEAESSSAPATSTKRSKKSKKAEDAVTKPPPQETAKDAHKDAIDDSGGDGSEDDEIAIRKRHENEDADDNNPFRGGYLGPGGPHASMSSTLRALSGYVAGVSQRLRDILNGLRQKDDPSAQLIALQDLSEILLVSNEDNLSGHFSPDQYVKELVSLMQPQPSDLGEDNPEMMLLACRCIANLMEALPQSTANVVYGGAVPVLCQKLLEIQYIDVAEQALSVCIFVPRTWSVLTVLDSRKGFGRVSVCHCTRGRFDSMSGLSRFLCDQHPEDSYNNRSELLQEHSARFFWSD